jgi:hypothetical protein
MRDIRECRFAGPHASGADKRIRAGRLLRGKTGLTPVQYRKRFASLRSALQTGNRLNCRYPARVEQTRRQLLSRSSAVRPNTL